MNLHLNIHIKSYLVIQDEKEEEEEKSGHKSCAGNFEYFSLMNKDSKIVSV